MIPVLNTPSLFPSVLSNAGTAVWGMMQKMWPQLEIIAMPLFLSLPLRDYVDFSLSSEWIWGEGDGETVFSIIMESATGDLCTVAAWTTQVRKGIKGVTVGV